MSHVLDWLIPMVVGSALGYIAAVTAEPLRQWLFRPRLKPEFGQGEEFITPTPVGSPYPSGKAFYVRIKVTNRRRIVARNCRAYLEAFEKRDTNGFFRPTAYCESIQLAWSCRRTGEEFNPLDLPSGVTQFLDVLATGSGSQDFHPKLMFVIWRYEPLFKQTGVFRLTIRVTAENAYSETIKLILTWQGSWDHFTVEQEKVSLP